MKTSKISVESNDPDLVVIINPARDDNRAKLTILSFIIIIEAIYLFFKAA